MSGFPCVEGPRFSAHILRSLGLFDLIVVTDK
jgi:hypothetical protein